MYSSLIQIFGQSPSLKDLLGLSECTLVCWVMLLFSRCHGVVHTGSLCTSFAILLMCGLWVASFNSSASCSSWRFAACKKIPLPCAVQWSSPLLSAYCVNDLQLDVLHNQGPYEWLDNDCWVPRFQTPAGTIGISNLPVICTEILIQFARSSFHFITQRWIKSFVYIGKKVGLQSWYCVLCE